MERGKKFEQKVETLFTKLESRYPNLVSMSPQFPVQLNSGRKVLIDFKLAIEFPHEFQNYYFELQSRNKHDHALSDKIEAIRRDTALSTFTFVHESELGETVAAELKSRNIIPKDWDALVTFTEGIELQLLQQTSASELSMVTRLMTKKAKTGCNIWFKGLQMVRRIPANSWAANRHRNRSR